MNKDELTDEERIDQILQYDGALDFIVQLLYETKIVANNKGYEEGYKKGYIAGGINEHTRANQ